MNENTKEIFKRLFAEIDEQVDIVLKHANGFLNIVYEYQQIKNYIEDKFESNCESIELKIYFIALIKLFQQIEDICRSLEVAEGLVSELDNLYRAMRSNDSCEKSDFPF